MGLNHSLTLNYESSCICDCEKNMEINSEKCNNKGDLGCGVCFCHEGITGRNCNCDKDLGPDPNNQCRNPESDLICNGRGSCLCGVCHCDSDYYGYYYYASSLAARDALIIFIYKITAL